MATKIENDKEIGKLKRQIIMQNVLITGLQASVNILHESLKAADIDIIVPEKDFPEPPVEDPAEPTDDYEDKERDELFDLAVERELNPHSQLGKAKLIVLLREADEKEPTDNEE